MIGQVYANLFPSPGAGDDARRRSWTRQPVKQRRGAGRRTRVGPADAVFEQFVALCQGAGPARCALARHPETAAARVARLFRRARRAPIPAPHADPPGELSYSDLLLTTFNPIRTPTLAPVRARTRRRRQRRRLGPGDRSAPVPDARRLYQGDDVGRRSSAPDGPARQPLSAWPKVIGHFTHVGKLAGTVPRLVAMGAVRGELAGARHRALHRPVERQDQDTRSCSSTTCYDPATAVPRRPAR